MASLARRLHRLRAHHPERALLAAAAAGTAVFLTLNQEVLLHLNLVAGP